MTINRLRVANESGKGMIVKVVSVFLGKAFGHCPDGLGQLFLGRICLILGGPDPCPDGLGHFFPR